MTHVIGPRTYPCGHRTIRPGALNPDTYGTPILRSCDVCKRLHTFTITPAPVATARCSTDVWRIDWTTGEPT